MQLSRIIFDTAQLEDEVLDDAKGIVRTAINNGINGFIISSETPLSGWLGNLSPESLRIILRLPRINWKKSPLEIMNCVDAAIRQVTTTLGLKTLFCPMFMCFQDAEKELIRGMLGEMKSAGKIGWVGVCVETPEEAELALNLEGIGLIHAQFSILDKRLLLNGFLQRAQAKGIIILAGGIVPALDSQSVLLEGFCKQEKTGFEGLAVRYALSIEGITSLALPVGKRSQLVNYIRLLHKGRLSDDTLKRINSMRDSLSPSK